METESHYYNPKHTGLVALGLKPHLLTDAVLEEMMSAIMRYKNNIKPEQIYRELTDKALTAFTPAQQEKLREEVRA